MRQVATKGLLTVMATGGVIAAGSGLAYADAGAAGTAADSPGVGSGNTVQVPVHVPVNVCGNTVNVVGALNPAIGNRCANVSGARPGPGAHSGGAGAAGGTSHSPGVGSGNTVQVPVHVPVNLCGNTVDVVGLLNPAVGNKCAEMVVPPPHPGHPAPPAKPCPPKTPGHPAHPGGGTPSTPGQSGNPGTSGHPAAGGTPSAPRAGTHASAASRASGTSGTSGTGTETLAHTGAGGIGLLASASGALLLGGTVLYRRGRSATR